MQTARTNGEDNFQFGIEAGVTRFSDDMGTSEGPSVNLAARYGVSDRLDIGVRWGTLLFEIQSKLMLTSPSEQDIAISLAPSVAVAPSRSIYIGTKIPLLIGITVGDSELTLAPRISPAFIAGESSKFILAAGGSIGFALRLGDTFWILPEISVDIPFIGGVKRVEGGESDFRLVNFDSSIINIGVGVLFGGRPMNEGKMPPASGE